MLCGTHVAQPPRRDGDLPTRPATLARAHRAGVSSETMTAPLTTEQSATVKRVWLETANASEAARQAGCSERSARRYIVKHQLPNSAELYAQALAHEERMHLAVVRKARRALSDALDTATPLTVVDLARAASDSLRAVTGTRTAHLKVSGLAAADKHDVTSGGEKIATVVMLPALDDVRTSNAQDPLAAEPRPSDEVSRE